MGKLRNLQIVFDGNVDVFSQNQVIRGQVMMEVDSEGLKNVKGVWIRFRGYSKIRIGSKNHKEILKDDYFDSIIVVLGTAPGHRDVKNLSILPGTNSFPFQFQLPNHPIPVPFEGRFGFVRFKSKATVSIIRTLMNKEYKTEKLFSMMGPTVDLNAIPGMESEVQSRSEERSCFGIGCGVQSVITVGLPRQGYVPGESIYVIGHMSNRVGKTSFKVTARLVQKVIFQFQQIDPKYRPFQKHTLSKASTKVKCPRGRETGFVVGPLQIPPVPSSGLPGCELINIEYYVKVNDSECFRKFLVTIGTVPLRTRCPVPQLVSATNPSADPPEQMPPTAPPYEAPPPTYEEAVGVMDRLATERSREDYFMSGAHFVPRYAYFNLTVDMPSTGQ